MSEGPGKMHSRRRTMFLGPAAFSVGLAALLSAGRAPHSWAVSINSIDVKLFGQPCQLQGPPSTAELRVIHSISPEQLPPATTLKQCQVAVDKLSQAKPLPAAFERYRSGMLEHRRAWEAFYKGQFSYRKRPKPEAFVEGVRPFLSGPDLDLFRSKLGTPELKDFYQSRLKAPPEQEFHRALKKLDAHYQCSFEESGESEESTEGGES